MSKDEIRYDPMPKLEVFEKVRKGCLCHMYSLDEQGYCAESDDYVVALAFFEDYLEKLKKTHHLPKENWLVNLDSV